MEHESFAVARSFDFVPVLSYESKKGDFAQDDNKGGAAFRGTAMWV
ncbi:MAG: hypothetical protein ACYS9T_12260 [Planctomycetota bacterium]